MSTPRRCARPDCGGVATATLAYQYATRAVWIGDLSDVPLPSAYDLCTRHADRLTVPVGWARDDQRTVGQLSFATRVAADAREPCGGG